MSETPSTAFSTTQYDAAYPAGIEHHWWTRARAEMVASTIRDAGGAQAPILEIGCGTGATLSVLRTLGLDCHGVEIANVSARADVKDVITTKCDALDLPQSARTRVQTILLLDVVEHIEDPEAFLRRIASGFPNARRLVITVPARQEIWSNYDEFYGHFRRYDLANLAALGAALGWKTRRLGYAFRVSYPPARVLAAFKQPRDVEIKAPSGALAIAAHRALAALTLWEWRWLPRRTPGTSVIASFDI